jgi:hypothetical protein
VTYRSDDQEPGVRGAGGDTGGSQGRLWVAPAGQLTTKGHKVRGSRSLRYAGRST